MISGHKGIDDRSLAFGRAIAAKLDSQPELISRAAATVHRWLITCSPQSRATLQEWVGILSGPRSAVVSVLTGTDARATRLRQSNPFTAALSPAERNAILRAHRTAGKHDPTTA